MYNHCGILHNLSFALQVLQHVQSTARTRSQNRIQLHHDNAAVHKARLTQTYLDENGIHLMARPPYPPDLAPCDFWLFPNVKCAIAGKPFLRIQDLAKAVHAEMRAMPASEYRQCFHKWRMRIRTLYRSGRKLHWRNVTVICEMLSELFKICDKWQDFLICPRISLKIVNFQVHL